MNERTDQRMDELDGLVDPNNTTSRHTTTHCEPVHPIGHRSYSHTTSRLERFACNGDDDDEDVHNNDNKKKYVK